MILQPEMQNEISKFLLFVLIKSIQIEIILFIEKFNDNLRMVKMAIDVVLLYGNKTMSVVTY